MTKVIVIEYEGKGDRTFGGCVQGVWLPHVVVLLGVDLHQLPIKIVGDVKIQVPLQ